MMQTDFIAYTPVTIILVCSYDVFTDTILAFAILQILGK